MKLTSLLPVLLVALCISAPAFAKGKPAPAPAPAASHSSSGSSEIHWNVSGPFQLLDGTAMFGANFSGDYFIQHDISLGGETGFMIGSNSIWEIPIVVTGKYHFAMSSMPNMRPYVGLGLGLSILHGGGGTVDLGGLGTATVSSSTSAKFRGELKIGTAFQDGPGLMAEIKLGLVDSAFLFAPSIGWNF